MSLAETGDMEVKWIPTSAPLVLVLQKTRQQAMRTERKSTYTNQKG